MNYLIDTDWVIDYLRGRTDAVTFLQRLAGDDLAISLITYGEVYEGILYGQNRPAHERGFRDFLRNVDVLPLNRRIMRRYGEIRGLLRRQGQTVGDGDLLIAATALDRGAPILTRNRNHFERVPGIEFYSES